LAITYQGSQAYLSLPPSCQGVSYSKAKHHGLQQLKDSVRKNEIAWKSVKTEENATSPELAKDVSREGGVRRM